MICNGPRFSDAGANRVGTHAATLVSTHPKTVLECCHLNRWKRKERKKKWKQKGQISKVCVAPFNLQVGVTTTCWLRHGILLVSRCDSVSGCTCVARAARAFAGHTVWYPAKEKGGGGAGGRGGERKREKGRDSPLCLAKFYLLCLGFFFISFLLLSDDIKLTLSDPYRRRENNEEESVKQGHLKQQGQERWAQRMELSL